MGRSGSAIHVSDRVARAAPLIEKGRLNSGYAFREFWILRDARVSLYRRVLCQSQIYVVSFTQRAGRFTPASTNYRQTGLFAFLPIKVPLALTFDDSNFTAFKECFIAQINTSALVRTFSCPISSPVWSPMMTSRKNCKPGARVIAAAGSLGYQINRAEMGRSELEGSGFIATMTGSNLDEMRVSARPIVNGGGWRFEVQWGEGQRELAHQEEPPCETYQKK